MGKWIHVPKLNEQDGAPIRSSTAYKWFHLKRFPSAFRKVGGKLFVNIEELYRLGEVRIREK